MRIHDLISVHPTPSMESHIASQLVDRKKHKKKVKTEITKRGKEVTVKLTPSPFSLPSSGRSLLLSSPLASAFAFLLRSWRRCRHRRSRRTRSLNNTCGSHQLNQRRPSSPNAAPIPISVPITSIIHQSRHHLPRSVNPLRRLVPRARVRAHPTLHLAPELDNLGVRLAIPQVIHESLDAVRRLLVALLHRILLRRLVDAHGNGHGAIDDVSHARKVLFREPAGGHGGRADAQTAGRQRRLVAGDGILVGSDADEFQHALDAAAVDALRLEVDQDEMVVGAAADNGVAQAVLVLGLAEAGGERLGVGENLALVGAELGRLGLLESNGEGGDGVVVGPALVAREDGGVDGGLEVVQLLLALLVGAADAAAEEDHGAAGAAEGLVAGGGDDVGVGEGAGHDLGGHETGDVGHVGHEVGVDLAADLAETGVVDQAAVSGGAGDDDLGAVGDGQLLELVVVDVARLLIETVGKGLEVLGDEGDLFGGSLVTMRKMAAVGEIEAHQAVVGVHEGRVDV